MASNDDMIRSTLNDFYSRIGLQKKAADETNAAGGGMENLKKKKSGDEKISLISVPSEKLKK